MRKILIISLLIIAGFTATFLNPQIASALPPKINLSPSDYSTGLTWEQAQKAGKPIVLNFYVDWCHYCQGFAPLLYKVRQGYSSKYSFVYINCEDPKNQALVNAFKIKGFPTLYLVNKKRHKQVQVDNFKFQSADLLKAEFNKFLK